MTNLKIERLGRALQDDLNTRLVSTSNPNPVTPLHDASGDLYLTITNGTGDGAIVKFEPEAVQASGRYDSLGIAQTVYTPHVTKLGYDGGAPGAQATDTATLTANFTAGDKLTVNTHDFVSVDSGAAGDQFNITGTKATGTAEVLAALSAGDSLSPANVVTINTHGFTAKNSGAAGDQFNVAGTPASANAQIGPDLIAGDKVVVDGHDFVSVDSGAVGDQWNIVGTKATGTATIGDNLTAGDKITVNTHDFTSVDSGAAGDQFNITGTKATGTATVGVNLTSGDKITVNTHDFTSVDSGAAGDQFNITGTKATGTATIGVDLIAGNKITVNTHDFTSVDSGAAGDQFNITGTKATGTATIGVDLIAGNKITVNTHDFTSVDSGAAGDQWNIVGTKAAGTATIGDNLTAGDKVTINTHDFVSVDSGAAGDQFNITGTQAAGNVLLAVVGIGDTVVINASTFTAIAGATDAANNFHVGISDAATATELSNCIGLSVAPAIAGVVTAIVDAITLEQVNITAVKKGTSGNSISLADGGSGHFTPSGAFLTGGAVTKNTCATALATAIATSVTVGITGVVTATPAAAVVNIEGAFKGTSGNVSLASTGDIAVSGVALTGGAVTVNDCATALATAIATSVTVGITGVVTATPAAAVVNLEGAFKGTSGNVALATSSGNIVISGAALTGGAVTVNDCATALATAIATSVTVGITGVVTATPAAAVVNLEGVFKGTSGNVALATSSGNIVISGAFLTGGAVTVNDCATALATAIATSVTVGITGVVTATPAAAVVNLEGVKKGTSGNVALATSSGNIAISGAFLTGGAVTKNTCASDLSAAIVASVTVGITGVVTATPAAAVVNLEGVKKGTSGNVSLASTGDIAVSGVALTGGAVTKNTCATALATAVATSVTVGITGVVTATPAAAVVNLEGAFKGTSGNVSLASTGDIAVSGVALTGGLIDTTASAVSLSASITASITVGISGVWIASGIADTSVVRSVAIGLLRNGHPFSATGDITASAATLDGGAVTLATTATNLASAIAASVTAGISGIVTAIAALAVVTINGVKKGTSGNVSLTQTGTGFTLSGVALTGGAVNLTTTAASLATAINVSATPGITGIVTATSALAVVTIKAVAYGIIGNSIPVTETGGHITVATSTLAGGINPTPSATSDFLKSVLIAECAPTGTSLIIYAKSGIAVTDLVDSTLIVATIRNIPWGMLASM